MKKLVAILVALSCSAQAQVNLTVIADTNRVIRTNFSLVRSQITDLSSATFAISNVTSLQGALDAKLATNGNAFALTNFPAALLRTNGDGGGLTNLPNANLSNATGVLPLLNGGTGATNASGARTALELGTAATNSEAAFQPANTNLTALASGDGLSLTNVTITDAFSLTNFPAELLRTNGNAGALTNFPAELLRTNGDGGGLTNVSVDLTTVLPPYAGNAGKVLAVNTNETDVEFTALSNTVTDGSLITNFPSFLLQTNGSASGLTNFPTLNQNTTGAASNVTGVVAIANGGSGQTTAAAAIEAFLPFYSGNADRVLALNSNATALLWTTNAGGGGGGLPETPLAISNGGTGAGTASGALTNFGILVTGNHVRLGVGATNVGAATNQVAIGRGAHSEGSSAIAIGNNAKASAGSAIAIGGTARSFGTDATQIGFGDNFGSGTIQFRNAGRVNTNRWAALANSSTFGHYVMAAPNNGTNGQILVLNSNATAVVWINNEAAVNLTNTNVAGVLPRSKGGTGGTNYTTALSGLGVFASSSGLIGSVVLGEAASAGVAGSGNVAIGPGAQTQTIFASTDSVALGRSATTTNADTVALGANARASSIAAVQIGAGTNSTTSTIQFLSAGTISTNEWATLAALSTYPTTNISVVGTNNTNTLVFSNGILTSVTTP